jgi:hypothetical protein
MVAKRKITTPIEPLKMTKDVEKKIKGALKTMAEDVRHMVYDVNEAEDEFGNLDPNYVKDLTIDDLAMFETALESADMSIDHLRSSLGKFNKEFRKYFPEG